MKVLFRGSSVATGKAIDVEAGSTEDGANVLEWESNDQDNQKWSFEQ